MQTHIKSYDLVVLGAGESGIGAAILATVKGLSVFVSDYGVVSEKYALELREHNIPFEMGKHSESIILNAKEIVKSPGIPDNVAIVKAAKTKGIAVISEIEFAYRYTDAFLIGITGSNGKTTTTTLTYHFLNMAGLNVAIAGNIGDSFARRVAKEKHDYYVLELSSFQLDGIKDFACNVAMLLNITPDHLDRYDYKLEKYVQSKFRIGKNQEEKHCFLYNKDDINTQKNLASFKGQANRLGIGKEAFVGHSIVMKNLEFPLGRFNLKGRHNKYNAAFAILAAIEAGVSKKAIQQGLDSFSSVPHRLEHVATFKEVAYINDSKATNVDAVFYALEAMDQPVIWIAGGTDKGNDYEAIKGLVADKVKVLICLGLDNSKLLQNFSDIVPEIVEVKSAQEAVAMASSLAIAGDTVLLSPACASFDLFNNYEDRGNQFKNRVIQLANLMT